MSHSIFISYSREDERQALHLLSVLRKEGFVVWIDQEAIAGASIWSDEIVQNIKSSQIFIALLSDASVNSTNVAKEIALAAEHGKIILPVEIGNVKLPGRLEYALAGIQKTSFHDEEAIIRAVRSQVARLTAEDGGPSVSKRNWRRWRKRMRPAAIALFAALLIGGYLYLSRAGDAADVADRTVIVLPFTTLNTDRDSTHDLDIFSDELINRLSSLNILKVASTSVSARYRDTRLNPIAIGRDLHTRYVVEGSVRKQNDVNYLSVRVYDTKEGGVIYEQTYSGNNHVIFPIRSELARQVEGFLRGIDNEKQAEREAESELHAHPNDASAYARLAHEVSGHDKIRAVSLLNEAIKRDSSKLEYYMNAGITNERLNAGSGQDYGRAAIPLAYAKVKQDPQSLNAVVNYAIALDLAGQEERAGAIYDSLMRLHPRDSRLMFNAACCYSRQAKADKALEVLQALLTAFPGRKDEVKYDPDFDNIRSNPGYLQLIYGFGR